MTGDIPVTPETVKKYLSAIIEIEWDGVTWIGIPCLEQKDSIEHSKAPGFLSDPAVVITACNPMGVNISVEKNAINMQFLSKRLIEVGLSNLHCVGRDESYSHIEESFLVLSVGPQELILLEALAIEFGQDAFFVLEKSTRTLRFSNQMNSDAKQYLCWKPSKLEAHSY